MTLYAESSALLAWLLEQEHGELVAGALAGAEIVIASDLTLIECDRVIVRAVVAGELVESDAVDRQARLNAVSERWTLLALDERSSSARGGRSRSNRSARWMRFISPAR